ncbi:fatty acid desaturase family protein [Exiguobacterium flavidum]|uniref:fatty acid desaturase family protein n=1 Tax=Exiguobacterium flavidum TaxID=2184695 RepID=UPI000DF83953|nr:acyl-CoA desaturase [Exiguobacterium flavidum]
MESQDLHSFSWYAARVKKHLPAEAFQPVPIRLLGGFAYVLVVITGFLLIGLLELYPIVNIAIALVIGMSFAAMGFLGHEILHGTVVRKAWIRNVLGAVFFWPLSTGPRLWRKWHNLTHHVHTQDEENDPDAWPTLQKLAKSPALQWVYRLPFPIRAFFGFLSLSLTFSLHSLHMFFVYIKDFKKETRTTVWLQMLLPWATWLGLLAIMGPVKWFFAFLLPLLIGNFIVMAYISTNHRLNPLVPVNDPLANSLTVTVPRWVDFLHFNFSYHTEHHLFPGMSSKYYPLVKARIKEMWPERYHEMPMAKAMIALYKTPRVYFDNTGLIDPKDGKLYGSLGHGLDPDRPSYDKIDVDKALVQEERRKEG